MADKIYIGTGKEREFQSGGTMIKMSFSREDLSKLSDNMDQAGWVRIDIKKRREPSKTGQTHYGELNTWKPEGQESCRESVKPLTNNAPDRSSDGEQERMPF